MIARTSEDEGVELVADAGGFTSFGLRLVRVLRHLGSPSRCLLSIPQYTSHLTSFFCFNFYSILNQLLRLDPVWLLRKKFGFVISNLKSGEKPISIFVVCFTKIYL